MTQTALPDSLSEVRASIPKECYERSTKRSLGYVARDLATYAVVAFLIVFFREWWVDVPLAILEGFIVGGIFILGHDAAHGAMSDSKKINDRAARILMLPSLHVKESWVFGHNRVHHGFTAREGMDFVWHPVKVEDYLAMSRLKKLRHRVEWSFFGAGAYYLREVWWNKMITFKPPEKWAKAIWRDWWTVASFAILFTIVTFGMGSLIYGSVLTGLVIWLELGVVPFLIFGQVIGWAVYVHHVGPEIRWWKKDDWTKWRGQMESTTILRMPRLYNYVFHHIFIHVPHHVDMRIPWYHLPKAAEAIEAKYSGAVVDKKFKLRDYMQSAKQCKLYDFDEGKWYSYKEALRKVEAVPS